MYKMNEVKLRQAYSYSTKIRFDVVEVVFPLEDLRTTLPKFYIQLVFKAPLCITLTISDQKIVSGSLFFDFLVRAL